MSEEQVSKLLNQAKLVDPDPEWKRQLLRQVGQPVRGPTRSWGWKGVLLNAALILYLFFWSLRPVAHYEPTDVPDPHHLADVCTKEQLEQRYSMMEDSPPSIERDRYEN